MKFLMFISVSSLIFAAEAPKPVQPKETYEISFEKAKADYSKKIVEVEKARKTSSEVMKKAVLSDSLLKVQADSAISVARKSLKDAYDIEITKITNVENNLKIKRAKVDSLYKEALITLEIKK